MNQSVMLTLFSEWISTQIKNSVTNKNKKKKSFVIGFVASTPPSHGVGCQRQTVEK